MTPADLRAKFDVLIHRAMFCTVNDIGNARSDVGTFVDALIVAASTGSTVLQYIDDHDWGTIPEGETANAFRAALSHLEEMTK